LPPATAGTGGPTYTYTAAGRLKTRVWLRGVTATYSYNQAGDLAGISYSDSTPGVTYGYDRRGRRISSTRDSMTTQVSFDDADEKLAEGYSGIRAGVSPHY